MNNPFRINQTSSLRPSSFPAGSSLIAAGMLFISFALAAPPGAAAIHGITRGEAPPPFSLKDRSGAVQSLEYLAGSPGAIVFWSTWSPRSAEMLEDFKKYYETYHPKGFRILSLNIDGENRSRSQVAGIWEYVDDMELPFPVLLDSGLEVFASWGVMAHPSVVIVDGEGRVAYDLGGYPLSLREELKDSILKVLGLYKEPEPEPPLTGYVPKGAAGRHFTMGMKMMDKGMTGRALASFRRAAEQDSGYIEPVVMGARLSLTEGDVEGAEGFIKAADPEALNRGDLRFLLGNIMLMKGRTEVAEKLFLALQKKYPEEGWGEWGLGIAALSRGETGKAVDFMDQARLLAPENMEARAYTEKYLKKSWLRGEFTADDDRFIAIFPDFSALRNRYRKLYGG